MSKKVKNISGSTLSIPDVGMCEAGETITVPDDFNSPNFEDAKGGTKEAEKSDPKVDTKTETKTEVKPPTSN